MTSIASVATLSPRDYDAVVVEDATAGVEAGRAGDGSISQFEGYEPMAESHARREEPTWPGRLSRR
jgi:beta-phosphoglucomutase-like phosphatase (HAD superfamily)